MTVYRFNLADPNKKIEAIKEFRSLTGVGLKEAKDVIEGLPIEYTYLHVKNVLPELKYGEWTPYKGFGRYLVIEISTTVHQKDGECEWWVPRAGFTHLGGQYQVCQDPNYYCYRGDIWNKHKFELPDHMVRHEFFRQCYRGWIE